MLPAGEIPAPERGMSRPTGNRALVSWRQQHELSVGTSDERAVTQVKRLSLVMIVQERRDQFHILRLGELLDSFNASVVSFLDQARAVFLQQSGDPSAAQQLALQVLENLRQQQASSLAYFDVFWLLAVVTLAPVLMVLLMKRSERRILCLKSALRLEWQDQQGQNEAHQRDHPVNLADSIAQ
jgi:hypothetical protein